MTTTFTHTTLEACKTLRVSDSTLRRLRQQGVLKPGVHYRALGDGAIKPTLIWDIAATDAALATRSAHIFSEVSDV